MTRGATAEVWSDRSMSLEEWGALPEDEPGELVDGRLVEEEVADPVHEDIVSSLNATIRPWMKPRGGFVLGSNAKYGLRPKHGRLPDLSVIFPGRPAPPRRGIITSPPDIMVEVISQSAEDVRRDRIVKADEY